MAVAPKNLLAVVDRAIKVQQPVVRRHIERVRRSRPDATPAEIIHRLEKQLLAGATSSGAAVGGAAAAPGVGTGVSLALSAGESVAFIEASALFSLAVADIHGVSVQDLERRRTLVFAILLGDAGVSVVEKAAGRTGAHWGKRVVGQLPMESIRAINRVLGPNFVTKYGTRQGIIVLGRAVPFGIGAAIGGGANALLSKSVISAARRAFGDPPSDWPNGQWAGKTVPLTSSTDSEDLEPVS